MERIFKLVEDSDKTDAYFEKWYDYHSTSYELSDYMYIDEEDFEHDMNYEFYLDQDLESMGSIDKESEVYKKHCVEFEKQYKKDKAREWFDNRLSNFESDVMEFSEDKIILYRALMVPCIEEFKTSLKTNNFGKYSGVGICWSYSEGHAEAHDGGSQGFGVLIAGEVSLIDIDPDTTLELNMSLSCGEDEKEIRLKQGINVDILWIESADKREELLCSVKA